MTDASSMFRCLTKVKAAPGQRYRALPGIKFSVDVYDEAGACIGWTSIFEIGFNTVDAWLASKPTNIFTRNNP